jgi:hypothetical protein
VNAFGNTNMSTATIASIDPGVTGNSRLRSNGFLRSDRRSYNSLFVADHFLSRERVDRLFPKWRRDLHAKLLERIRANGEGRSIPLPRIRNLDRETFMREFVAKSHPVVFPGAAKNWECCRKWTFQWFKEHYGADDVFLVDHAAVERNPLGKDSEHLTFADLIDGIDQGSMKYARFHPLLQRHPELRNDIDQRWVKEHVSNPHTGWMRFYTLFMGGKGTDTAIHNAGNPNLFIQVCGQKLWRFYPEEHTPIFDPLANRSIYKYTTYHPDDPDYERFPMARHMDYYETVLEPGDILYNPSYYWHHVSNPDRSIAVAYRWADIGAALRGSRLLTAMEFFNTNPNLIKGMITTMRDFNEVLALNRRAAGKPR